MGVVCTSNCTAVRCPRGGLTLLYLLNGLPPDLRHDGTLSPKVLIAQAQEVIDDKGCGESRVLRSAEWSLGIQQQGKGLSTAALSPGRLLMMADPFRIQGGKKLGQRAMDPLSPTTHLWTMLLLLRSCVALGRFLKLSVPASSSVNWEKCFLRACCGEKSSDHEVQLKARLLGQHSINGVRLSPGCEHTAGRNESSFRYRQKPWYLHPQH